MWKKLKNSKSVYIVLSVLLAFILWAYVVNEVNPPKEQSLTGLPVVFQGADILEAKNLIITEGASQTADLDLKTDWDTAGKLNRGNVSLLVPVSSITEPGVYRIRAEVSYPGNVSRSNITIQNDESLYIEFTVAKLVTREIQVRPKFAGSVAENYQGGEFTISPESLEIRGQEEIINQIAYAEVVLGELDMNKTFSGDLPFTFKDSEGGDVDSAHIQCDVGSIYVIYPIVKVAEVPLTVSFLPGGGATEADIDPDTFTIQPSSISISGPEEIISRLTELPVGEIDLSTVTNATDFKVTFPIKLSEGLTNESGITEVTVTLTLTGLAMKEFEVDQIKLTNIPDGYHAELVTQTRVVLIRGKQEELDDIFQAQIRIEADLSQLPSNGVGRQTAPVKVYVDGGGSVGAVGSYSVVVNLSKQ